MPFEQLKNYRNGEVWSRLLEVQPEQAIGVELFEPEIEPFEPLFRSRPDVIYHYTTVSGLQGILQSNRLWASAAYYLNDSSEIEYGCQLVREAIVVWRTANQKNESFAVDTLRVLDTVFSSPLSRLSRTSTIYVTCFCENGNLLSQWRAYGQAGGYSLGFAVQRQKMALRIPGEFWDLRLARVIYSVPVQQARINSLLKQTLLAISDPSLENVVATRREDLRREVVLYIQELLLDDIVTFKNPAFREEKEWRLIVRPSLIGTQQSEPSEVKGSPFRFRGSRGSLVPYLELHPEGERIPLKSVRFGPSLEASRAENSVRMLLASCGFKDVTVSGSQIPVIL